MFGVFKGCGCPGQCPRKSNSRFPTAAMLAVSRITGVCRCSGVPQPLSELMDVLGRRSAGADGQPGRPCPSEETSRCRHRLVNQSSSGQVADKDLATLVGCLSLREVNYVHQYPASC